MQKTIYARIAKHSREPGQKYVINIPKRYWVSIEPLLGKMLKIRLEVVE